MHHWGEIAARWSGIRTEWIDVHGTAVRLLRADGPPEGTPQLLVHGLGGSAFNWLEVMVPLARRGPVVAVDLPGFGETRPPTETASHVRVNARFVSALCRALGWDRIVLMGNSMGGMISVLVAGHRQDLVESLVLVNPALPAPVSSALKVPAMTLAFFVPFAVPGLGERLQRARYDRRSAAELFDETMSFVMADRSRLSDELAEVGIANTRRGKELEWRLPAFVRAAESLMSLLTGLQRRVAYRSIDTVTAPTLLLWGDADWLVGEPIITGMIERRADWDLHVFRGVGHVPMIEVPDDFLSVVGDWLDDHQVPAESVARR